jgi:hypothetical protein
MEEYHDHQVGYHCNRGPLAAWQGYVIYLTEKTPPLYFYVSLSLLVNPIRRQL